MGSLERRITRLEEHTQPREGAEAPPEWAVQEAASRLSDEELYAVVKILREAKDERLYLSEEEVAASPALRRWAALLEEVLNEGGAWD